jgi:hypothetical protein
MVLTYLETQGEVPANIRMELRKTAMFVVAKYKMDLALYLDQEHP